MARHSSTDEKKNQVRTLRAQTLLVTFLAAGTVGVAGAQPVGNPPGAPGPTTSKPPQGLSGKASFGFLSTSGNTESTNMNAALALVYRLETWRHHFDLSAIGASTNNETTTEAYRAKYEARRDIGRHGYAFTALDWDRDRFSGFDSQSSMTAGYGRRFVDTPKQSVDGGLGAGARDSVLPDGSVERDAVLRTSLDYVWTLSSTSQFEQALVVETGSTNTSTDSVTSLKAGLFGNVGLVISYRLKYNSQVPPGIVNSDRYSSVSLEYAF